MAETLYWLNARSVGTNDGQYKWNDVEQVNIQSSILTDVEMLSVTSRFFNASRIASSTSNCFPLLHDELPVRTLLLICEP